MWKCRHCGKTHITKDRSLACQCLIGKRVATTETRFLGLFGVGQKTYMREARIVRVWPDGVIEIGPSQDSWPYLVRQHQLTFLEE